MLTDNAITNDVELAYQIYVWCSIYHIDWFIDYDYWLLIIHQLWKSRNELVKVRSYRRQSSFFYLAISAQVTVFKITGKS